jgi:hypothetical protein
MFPDHGIRFMKNFYPDDLITLNLKEKGNGINEVYRFNTESQTRQTGVARAHSKTTYHHPGTPGQQGDTSRHRLNVMTDSGMLISD